MSVRTVERECAEFSEIRWFTLPELRAEPIEHVDPHMHRFITKLARTVG